MNAGDKLTLAPACAMAPDGLPFDVNLNALLSPHDMRWPDGPPADWMRGAPIGNGAFGAVIYGFPENLRLALAKTDVWEWTDEADDMLPGPDFATFRRTFLDGDREAYEAIIADHDARHPDKTKHPHLTTCGTFSLSLDPGVNPIDAAMRVRLVDGTMELTYTDRAVRALVSREYEVLMVEFDRGEGKPAIGCHSVSPPAAELRWGLERPRSKSDGAAMAFRSDDGICLGTQALGRGASFTVGVAFPAGAFQVAELPGRCQGLVTGALPPTVAAFVTIASSRECDDTEAECRRRLRRAMASGPQAIRDAHVAWWHRYWMRGLAAVGDADVERFYYRSLYLCGSILEPGRQSPGLQGVWAGDLHPEWNADYHANVNIQAVYWGLPTNNRADLMEPYLRLYHGFANHARAVARDYFGMRGLRFPHAGSIAGRERTAGGWATLAVCPCGSVWIAQLFWQYYEFSQDRAFLEEIGYPILRDTARFLVDYLFLDKDSREYVIAPSAHFETLTPGFDAWGTNSLYANAMFRVGLQQAIRAADVLGVDGPEQAEWQDRLDRLVQPPTTEEGIFKAFEDKPPVYVGHNFMLPHVFPGGLVSAHHGPTDWRETALATWRSLREQGEPCITGSPWCGGQGLCEILRIGEVALAFERARWPRDAQENGFSRARNGKFIQVDHGPGMCRVLGDMMLLTLGGVLHLFPGIPDGVPARFLSLRASGGFLVSAEKRHKPINYAVVEPTAPGTLRLANAWGGPVRVTDMSEPRVILETADAVLVFVLAPGRRYLIARPDMQLADFPRVPFAFPETPLDAEA